jgi:beta-lactamase regulating signal transducer with metallopeptidase domain/protocatechuate 3,4-dioxygenase beta subunit
MSGIIAVGMEERLLDVSVAVATLLAIALLLIRLAWQPARRLGIIQWTLIAGLVLPAGAFFPKRLISLGLLNSSPANAAVDGPVKVATLATTRLTQAGESLSPSGRGIAADSEKTPPDTTASGSSVGPTANAAARIDDPRKALADQSLAAPALRAREPNRWSEWFEIAYLFGALGMVVWLGLGQWTVRRLVRRGVPPESELGNVWEALQAEILATAPSRRRSARLLISNDLSCPIAVGIRRPAVLLPRSLVQSYTLEQLRPILVHELAHTVRNDAALRLVAALFQVAFYYQPLYWLLRREMRLCQEYLADAQAAVHARSASDYAEQLVALLKAAPARCRQPVPGISIVARRSELYRRIQMLVRSPRKLTAHASPRWNLITGFGLFIFAQSLGWLTLRAADPPPLADLPQPQAKTADETRKQAADSPPIQFEFRFQVVTTKGNPVVGATVRPWAVSLAWQGSSFSLDEKQFPPQKTDAQGVVRIVFPSVGVLRDLHERDIFAVSLRVDHPDHPVWSNYVAVGGDENRVVLSDSTTVEIRAHRTNETALLRRLYPIQEAPFTDWSEADGVLTLRRVDLTSDRTSRWLRIVHVPEKGLAWFSDLLDLKAKPGNPIAIDATMQTSVRVEGRLTDRVPRPIKNGRIQAMIVDVQGKGREASRAWTWSAAAPIADDGTFLLDSLPANDNLQLVALCDGWVSSAPTASELSDYSKQNDFAVLYPVGPEDTNVVPRLYRLDGHVTKPVIPMDRTGICEVTVVDEDGRPISGAAVGFSPNQIFYHYGSTLVGGSADMLTAIRTALASGSHEAIPPAIDRWAVYSATTDARGVAIVRDLPAGKEVESAAARMVTFVVSRDGYVATANSQYSQNISLGIPLLVARVSPSKTERITVRMRKSSEAAVGPEVGEDELAGRVVDEQGQAIQGARVIVWERDDEKIRTDKDGRFRHKFTPSSGDRKHLLVRFMKEGYAPYLVLDWRLGTKNADVVLSNKSYFQGVVRRPDGKPAANVLIRANQGPKMENPACAIYDIWTETHTDAEGQYKLLVQPDWYVLEIRASSVGAARVPKATDKALPEQPDDRSLPKPHRPKIMIRPNEVKKLDIQLEPGIEFRAKIVDSLTGRPVPGVRLWHWQNPGIEGRSNEAGLVTISAMMEGEFQFMIEAKGYVRGRSDDIPERWKKIREESRRLRPSTAAMQNLDDGMPFDLSPEMPRVTISLEPGVTITGRVLDPDGKPVVGATVAPARSGKGVSLTGDTRYSVATNKNGAFSVVLPPSDDRLYNIIVHDGEYQQWRHWANGVGPVIKTQAGQKIDNIELRLNRPGAIRGRVVDKEGKPVAHVYVQTTATDGLENNYYNPATRSDKEGKFELPFVRPGKQLLHGWMLVGDQAKDTEGFPVVEVKAGETTDAGDVFIPSQYQDRR